MQIFGNKNRTMKFLHYIVSFLVNLLNKNLMVGIYYE